MLKLGSPFGYLVGLQGVLAKALIRLLPYLEVFIKLDLFRLVILAYIKAITPVQPD